MGKTITELANGDPKIDIMARCDLGDPIEPAMRNCDVAIDFSHAGTITEICAAALQHRKPLVIGTTGHSTEQRGTIEKDRAIVADRVRIQFQRRSQCAFLADAQSCRATRRRF